MSFKPLSYDSLKCVLQYMEVNKRLQVSNKCPSIRTAERAVPLKIDSLDFVSTGQIRLNNTVYRIGIYQNYLTGTVPSSIRKSNEEGGVPYEVDKFGIEDSHDEFAVLPGDIKLDIKRMAEVTTDDEMILRLEKSIGKRVNGPRRATDSENDELLEEERTKLAAYQYRRNGVTPPYEHFIQITVESAGLKYTERYYHSKKYSEATKQLATFLFGKRREPIHVTHFITRSSITIIRLPEGVKFRVSHLAVYQPVGPALKALKPILHESSFPLKGLMIYPLAVTDLALPIVREAAVLTVFHGFASDQLLPLLLNATNQRVRFLTTIYQATGEDLLGLIDDWVQTDRPIGTHFSISMEGSSLAEFIGNRTFINPMTNGKEIRAFGTESCTFREVHFVVEAVEQK